ncbi:UDP-glycosyltransferase 91C1-like, partial [Momordica charantia]|uniref:UDP-glycosyltransferase 91C1-like n=1 Tax=Momordica charantia TaxID=3673 RepID=A0A6J1BSJ6_MOMCH
MAADKKLHIVMFPWLAFGHMIPYLQLSKLIAQKGHHVSFVSTPANIRRLPKIHPDLAPFINFINLPLPSVENVPQNAEATTDLPYDKVQYLKKAYDLLKQPLTEFLRSSDADWILYDFAPYWVPQEIGPNLGVKTALFSVFPPECMAFLGPLSGDHRKNPEDFTVTPDWIPFPTTVAFRYFEIKKIFDCVTGNVTGVSDLERLKLCAHHGDAVVVRGSPDFNPEWIRVLGDIYGNPILPVGQLLTTEYDAGDHNPAWRPIKEWLDKQPRGSVVYVAFGSEAKPSQRELE